VGFQLKDLNNRLRGDDKKSFDSSDANPLIVLFEKRFNNEVVCFYDIMADVNGCSTTFFLA